MTDISTPAPLTNLPPVDASQPEADTSVAAVFGPRKMTLSTVFFKSFAGLGIGIIGTIVLLIFVLLGIGLTAQSVQGPFATFMAIVMGLVTTLLTNGLAVYAFGMIDRDKYSDISGTLQQVATANMTIFVCLLPVYLIAIMLAPSGQSAQAVFTITALQLIISAMVSAFTLEVVSAENQRDRLLAIYSITLGLLVAVLIDLTIYRVFEWLALAQQKNVAEAMGTATVAILLSILPITWFFFGFFSSATEMLYRWIYTVWGIDYLARK